MSTLHLFFFFFLLIPRPPISTLFPYTTLFRSVRHRRLRHFGARRGSHPRCGRRGDAAAAVAAAVLDRKSTRLNSSHVRISYAVFCLKKKKSDSTPALSTITTPSPAHKLPRPPP